MHEIKHDGFRMMVRRDPAGVRLLTRNANDWTDRFPLIAEAAGGRTRSEYSEIAQRRFYDRPSPSGRPVSR